LLKFGPLKTVFAVQEFRVVKIGMFHVSRGPFRDGAQFRHAGLSLTAGQTLKAFAQSFRHHTGHGFSSFLGYRCGETVRLWILDIQIS
jgi:hypothetical protein